MTLLAIGAFRDEAATLRLNSMKLLLLDDRDNIAVAVTDLHSGEMTSTNDIRLTIRSHVPRGHKVALHPIARGADIIRYGEPVGEATSDIASGEHVHVQNVISKRLPGGPR
ncbi:UxaA family hydrolase [Rhodococcus pseudokoreensis]|uniref:UxaA family hydrolase n=1 Tax=Rhodococcus pseudokoreensis TaxID=2811421 RepID=A0A974W6S5_9NOCA|nr:UxaA family hydrolase [Rhodococcus pseudokoreensis]QSE92149.1 UxaA family hydrolase [Rhodococcus pseudokoreensis]